MATRYIIVGMIDPIFKLFYDSVEKMGFLTEMLSLSLLIKKTVVRCRRLAIAS